MLRGKRLRSQTKEDIANVYDVTDSMFFKQTSDTTRVSCTSIKRLQKRHLIMMELFLNSNKEIWTVQVHVT